MTHTPSSHAVPQGRVAPDALQPFLHVVANASPEGVVAQVLAQSQTFGSDLTGGASLAVPQALR